METITHTHHSKLRAAQRGVSDHVLRQAVRLGRIYHVGDGVRAMFVGKKEQEIARRLHGTHLPEGLVVMVKDGHVITVYRNKKAPRFLKKRCNGQRARQR